VLGINQAFNAIVADPFTKIAIAPGQEGHIHTNWTIISEFRNERFKSHSKKCCRFFCPSVAPYGFSVTGNPRFSNRLFIHSATARTQPGSSLLSGQGTPPTAPWLPTNDLVS
jgi:hypothetical protein